MERKALCSSLIALSFSLPCVWLLAGEPQAFPGPAAGSTMGIHATLEALKLVLAGVIGVIVSAVHRRYPGDKPISRSLAPVSYTHLTLPTIYSV